MIEAKASNATWILYDNNGVIDIFDRKDMMRQANLDAGICMYSLAHGLSQEHRIYGNLRGIEGRNGDFSVEFCLPFSGGPWSRLL